MPKRQLEELAARAAEDFDAFYEGRSADSVREAAKTGKILALSTDGNGIVMRTADLRQIGDLSDLAEMHCDSAENPRLFRLPLRHRSNPCLPSLVEVDDGRLECACLH